MDTTTSAQNASFASAMVGISSSLIGTLLTAAKTSTTPASINHTSGYIPHGGGHSLGFSNAVQVNGVILGGDNTSMLSPEQNTAIAIPSLVTSPPTFEEPPVEDWCFDLIVFYRSIAEDDALALNVLRQLETYSKFSFMVNGLMTCMLASFGLLGNTLFVSQLYKSRYFSRRLALHLAMLCVWDMALLLCCLLTYGIMASYYGILPFVGIVAYLLYFFQPFASFCVTGTIWQVLAITVERYTAVSRPLEQRTRNAQFSLRTICFAIAVGAFILNMVVVPFERRLTDCYEFTQNGYRIRTMIVQQDLVNNQYYAILAHLVPDVIFRAPTPIIIIAILTVRTLQICARRTVGTHTIHQARRNVPFMLTLLNVKFIMCNTLYMFNTILMEVMGYGGKTSNQQTELEMEEYVKSLYLTDFSNMLLAIHSATNWLIFYHWPRCTKHQRRKKLSSLTLTSNVMSKGSSVSMNCTSNNFVIDANTIEAVAHHFAKQKYFIATKILIELCLHSEQISRLLLGRSALDFDSTTVFFNHMNGDYCAEINGSEPQLPAAQRESLKLLASSALSSAVGSSHCEQIVHDSFVKNVAIQKHSKELGDLIEKVLNGLANKSSICEWRDMCRKIGYSNYRINLYCSAGEWKLVRNILVQSMDADAAIQATSYFSRRSATINDVKRLELQKPQNCYSRLCCYDNNKVRNQKTKDAQKIKSANRSDYDVGMLHLQRAMLKAFNFALREMKSGALCAIVDNARCHHQHTLQPQRSLNINRGDLKKFASVTSSIEHLEHHTMSIKRDGGEQSEDDIRNAGIVTNPTKIMCNLALSECSGRIGATPTNDKNISDVWKRTSCDVGEMLYVKRKNGGDVLANSFSDPS